MIKPQTLTEKILFSTLRVQTDACVGTGFFFQFEKDGRICPVLITNRHVINGANKFVFSFHVMNESQMPSNENIKCNASREELEIFEHPTLDLCCIPMYSIISLIEQAQNKRIFYKCFDESLIWNNTELQELNVLEEVYMVGYPIGLCDEKHNMPIFRRGITASHPAIDFDGKQEGLIDCACFPGSSGSPIIIYKQGYKDKQSGNYMLASTRFVLLGILWGGLEMNVEGKIVMQEISTKPIAQSRIPTNLGYYIKASTLLYFKEKLFS